MAGLPFLRAAVTPWRDPYNILFGSSLARLGLSSLLNGYGNHPFFKYHFLLDKNLH